MSFLAKTEVVVDHKRRQFQVQAVMDVNISREQIEKILEEVDDRNITILGDVVINFENFMNAINDVNRLLFIGYTPVGRGTKDSEIRLVAVERIRLGDRIS
jgi:hypothetical protein